MGSVRTPTPHDDGSHYGCKHELIKIKSEGRFDFLQCQHPSPETHRLLCICILRTCRCSGLGRADGRAFMVTTCIHRGGACCSRAPCTFLTSSLEGRVQPLPSGTALPAR